MKVRNSTCLALCVLFSAGGNASVPLIPETLGARAIAVYMLLPEGHYLNRQTEASVRRQAHFRFGTSSRLLASELSAGLRLDVMESCSQKPRQNILLVVDIVTDDGKQTYLGDGVHVFSRDFSRCAPVFEVVSKAFDPRRHLEGFSRQQE